MAACRSFFVTADLELTTRMDALNAGAIDFLTKRSISRSSRRASRISPRCRSAEAPQRKTQSGLVDSTEALREQECEIIQRITLAAGYKDPQAAQQAHAGRRLFRSDLRGPPGCRRLLA